MCTGERCTCTCTCTYVSSIRGWSAQCALVSGACTESSRVWEQKSNRCGAQTAPSCTQTPLPLSSIERILLASSDRSCPSLDEIDEIVRVTSLVGLVFWRVCCQNPWNKIYIWTQILKMREETLRTMSKLPFSIKKGAGKWRVQTYFFLQILSISKHVLGS